MKVRSDWRKYFRNPPQSTEYVTFKATVRLLECLISRNTRNRNPSEARIRQYYIQAIEKRWIETNEPLAVGRDGALFDGGHRAEALLRALKVNPNLNINITIMFGMTEEAWNVINVGRPRRVSETLKRRYNLSHPGARVSYVSMCIRLLTGKYVPLLTVYDYFAWEKYFKEGLEWAADSFAPVQTMRAAQVAGPLVFAYSFNPKKIRSFGQQILADERPRTRTPGRLLREHIYKLLETDKRLPRGKDSLALARRTLMAAMHHCERLPMKEVTDDLSGVRFYRKIYNSYDMKAITDLYLTNMATPPWASKKAA